MTNRFRDAVFHSSWTVCTILRFLAWYWPTAPLKLFCPARICSPVLSLVCPCLHHVPINFLKLSFVFPGEPRFPLAVDKPHFYPCVRTNPSWKLLG